VNALDACWQLVSGVGTADAKAAKLHSLAADMGYAGAIRSLQFCFENGTGVERVKAKAVLLYLRLSVNVIE
jgi:TPR repeat protein